MVMEAVASFILSPLIFRKKQESRFYFAHSVDPGFKSQSNDLDWDEIEVPDKIQDLIEKNIRTLSNSMSSKGLNTSDGCLDLRNIFREHWFTKKEKMMAEKDSSLRRKE